MQESTDAGPVTIFDTTLRDGEQSPNTSFTYDEKREIASRLDEVGTSVIEAGFPVISDSEFRAVRDVADSTEATTCALARVVDHDLNAAIESGAGMVHLFVSTSDVQLDDSMHASRSEAIERSVQAVRQLNEAEVDVMFSPMDATRTDEAFLDEIIGEVSDEGVDWINLPDTCGVATPRQFGRLVRHVMDSSAEAQIAVHPHNDFGLATANAVSGIEAGADQVQVSVNGIGERAGNAAYEEVVMALESLYGRRTTIDTTNLVELSELVEETSGISVPVNKPVVGENVFSHESGIHAAGVIENSETFEPAVMTPEQVGAERKFVIGKHTGTHTVRKRLEEAGYAPTDEQVRTVTEQIKSASTNKKNLNSEELKRMAVEVGMKEAR